jgi:PII-like signaling protein
MEGYLLTLFTQRSREHGETSLADWIVAEAKELGVSGATLQAATEGFGHDGRSHSAGFFDLEDQPVQVVMAVSPDECERLFARFRDEGVRVFYTKARVEFGFSGET